MDVKSYVKNSKKKNLKVEFLVKSFRSFFNYLFNNPIFLAKYLYYINKSNFKIKFKKPLTGKKMIDYCIKNNKSILRMSDGEIGIINRNKGTFQKTNEHLRKDLLKIIRNYNSEKSPYLISLPLSYLGMSNIQLKKIGRLTLWLSFKIYFNQIFNQNEAYGSALIFRNKSMRKEINRLWENKIPVIVTSKENIENFKAINLKKELGKVKDILFVPICSNNAYEKLPSIKKQVKEVVKDYKKEDLRFLFAVGPAAKVLVRDYSMDGFTSYDVGFYLSMISSKELYDELSKEKNIY